MLVRHRTESISKSAAQDLTFVIKHPLIPMAHKSKSTALIVKTMGVFSGVQVISILVSVVRTKLVAIWIGAVGVGLFGVFNTVLDLLGNFAQMGMNTVAARELAAHEERTQRVRYILMVRRICMALGLLFTLLTIGFSPLLSQWAFGDGGMTWWFCLLSVAIFAMAVSGGEGGILMGLHKLKGIALATTWGNVIGLAVTVPLFYFWRATAIVPSIVILWVITTSIMWHYAHKATRDILSVGSQGITWRSSMTDGFHIIKLGFYIIISIMMINLGAYLFLVYLNRTADTATVGYFQSGFTLINRYVGLVFAALMVDFFPRLSMCQRSRRAMSATVSQELGVIMGVMIPLVLLFVAFVPVIIEVLYTRDFQIIQPMVYMGIIGTVFRALSCTMAYVMLARADGLVYMAVEVASAAVYVGASILCFNLWGIPGMGIAYIIWYVVYTAVVGTLYRLRYGLKLSGAILKLSAWAVVAAVGSCALVMLSDGALIAHCAVGLAGVITAIIILPKLIGRKKKKCI